MKYQQSDRKEIKMTDIEKLNNAIKESGYRVQFLAEKLNLSNQGFLNKRNGIHEFTTGEVSTLQELLKLSDDEMLSIFFVK